jgi:Lon protease-like protein
MTQQLPLFPLHTVLFPGAPVSLHIFEERYRLMIARCLEHSAPFGVVLIRSGGETSPDATPHAVGTSALIGDSVRLEDGRYYLVATGLRRFRIQNIVQRLPYLVAAVSYLPEEQAGAAGAVSQLRELYARYWATLAAATGQAQQPEPLPDDPLALTYALAHRLKVNNSRKQRWLTADSLTRARELAAVLRAELALLPTAGPAHSAGTAWSWN